MKSLHTSELSTWDIQTKYKVEFNPEISITGTCTWWHQLTDEQQYWGWKNNFEELLNGNHEEMFMNMEKKKKPVVNSYLQKWWEGVLYQ